MKKKEELLQDVYETSNFEKLPIRDRIKKLERALERGVAFYTFVLDESKMDLEVLDRVTLENLEEDYLEMMQG